MKQRTTFLLLGAVAIALLGLWFGPRLHRAAQAGALPELLSLAPADSTTVIYADLAALRHTRLVEQLMSMAPPVTMERDYTEFVRNTGFAFERDLDRVVLVSRPGASTQTLVFAEGRFDRKKISEYALRSGKMENRNGHALYILPSTSRGKNMSIAFLEGDRIALSDGGDPFPTLPATAAADPLAAFDPALRDRLSRVGGSPFFAVVKIPERGALPPSSGAAAMASTPFQYVRWISIAAQPTGEQIVLSAEGECDDPANAQKVANALEFMRALLSGGLSNPQSRGRMSAEGALAASRLLQGAKITNEAQRVRLLVSVTPEMIDALKPAVTVPLPR